MSTYTNRKNSKNRDFASKSIQTFKSPWTEVIKHWPLTHRLVTDTVLQTTLTSSQALLHAVFLSQDCTRSRAFKTTYSPDSYDTCKQDGKVNIFRTWWHSSKSSPLKTIARFITPPYSVCLANTCKGWRNESNRNTASCSIQLCLCNTQRSANSYWCHSSIC